MNPNQPPKGSAEAFAFKIMRPSFAIVAIALMMSLALSSTIQGVSSAVVMYEQIISNQEGQLAALRVGQSRSVTSDGGAPTAQELRETNRIIVKYKEKDLPPGLIVAAERANIEKAQGLKNLLTINGINAVVYEVSEDDTAQEVVDRMLASNKNVIEYAEPDMLVPPSLIPNDPYFPNQWQHTNVQTPTAWDTAQGEGVTVAILDTGVDATHPDLPVSDVPGWNFYDNNSDTSDVHGHGTRVAGVAVATINNTIGVVGVAPAAKILPIRIADPSAWAYFSAMASGLTYAADKGARVANISYGNSCDSATVVNAANYMRSKGGIVTISAGNTASDNGMLAASAITCISSTDSNDQRSGFSSWGASVDVSAPGGSVYTTSRGGGYSYVSGTSFSAPLTAGIYALMFSVNPALTPNQADNILYSTADDIGDPGWDMYYGYGRVNAAKAVATAQATIGTRDTVAPTPPTNLRTTSVAYNSASLAWNPATDENTGVASYEVFQNGTKRATISGTSYTDTNLTPLTAYIYTVRAVDGAGNVSPQSNTLSVTTSDTPFLISSYSVPTKTVNSATVSISLSKPGTVTVNYGTSATSITQSAQSSTSGTTHSVNIGGLAANTTYYYQVVATDSSGTVISSGVSSFKTPKATGAKRR